MSLTINNESFTIINNGKSFEILKDNASLDRSPTRVYMNGFWWDLEKATADGYVSLDDLYNTLRDKIDHRYAGGGSGGSSALFPNGAEVITTSGEYQSSYAGKLLVLGAGVELTMPLVNPLPTCNVGVVSFVEESEGRGKFNLENGAGLIKPAVDEVITILSFAGNNTLGLTAPVRNDGVSGEVTLYEKLENTLGGGGGTATLVSGTVTVATDKVKTGYKIYVSVNTPSGTQGFLSAPTAFITNETSFVINSTSATDDSTVNWWIAP